MCQKSCQRAKKKTIRCDLREAQTTQHLQEEGGGSFICSAVYSAPALY